MKKMLALILICILSLTGCGNSADNNGGSTSVAVADDINQAEAKSVPTETDVNKETTSPVNNGTGDVVEITENLFIAQTNDIYINTEDYLGKTIKYEGIFDFYYWEESDSTYYYVIRYGPGCCGYDGTAGFEVLWDGEYPEQNDWVEAVGVLETYDENGSQYLRLRLTSLTVLDERGAEYVAT